jgi:hypothetical protein
MGEPKTQVKDRKELLGDLNETLGVDYPSIAELDRMNAEFIAYAEMMNIKPMTLLFMTNRLKEMARETVFYQYLNQHRMDIDEPSEEEIGAIRREFEEMCEIVDEESKKTLIIKHEMMSKNEEKKRSAVNAHTGQVSCEEEKRH